MKILKLIFKNAFRHKLRSVLTAFGIAIAILAFGLLRTVMDAYFVGVDSSSNSRLVTRNSVSLTISMPYAYKKKISAIAGVTHVSVAQWFGGTYKDPKNFFAQFAIEPETFLELYPEYLLTEQEMENFIKERNSCIVGATLAERYGWEVGDSFRLIGAIYPGNWDFVIRGIYRGAEKGTNLSTMFFHYPYLDESLKAISPGRAGRVGAFYIGIENPENAAQMIETIDAMFANSPAETKTETEREFRMGFVSMVGTILTAVRIISIVVVAIILLVLANTMAMTARERISEYAVLKTLGFQAKHLLTLIFGESVFIAIFGGLIGLLIMFPVVRRFGVFLTQTLGNFFPIFEVSATTLILAAIASLTVGVLAACFPAIRAIRMKISDGLRTIG